MTEQKRKTWLPVGSMQLPHWQTEVFAAAFNEWRPIAEHLTEEDANNFCEHKRENFHRSKWRVVYINSLT